MQHLRWLGPLLCWISGTSWLHEADDLRSWCHRVVLHHEPWTCSTCCSHLITHVFIRSCLEVQGTARECPGYFLRPLWNCSSCFSEVLFSRRRRRQPPGNGAPETPELQQTEHRRGGGGAAWRGPAEDKRMEIIFNCATCTATLEECGAQISTIVPL